MKKIKPALCIAAVFAKVAFYSWTALAATTSSQTGAASKQANVEVSWVAQPDGQVQFNFKAKPAEGFKINTEGPWALEIREHKGLNLAKAKLGKAEFKESIPGFSLLSKATATSGKMGFKMTVFICTESKAQCFRDVQQGSVPWSLH